MKAKSPRLNKPAHQQPLPNSTASLDCAPMSPFIPNFSSKTLHYENFLKRELNLFGLKNTPTQCILVTDACRESIGGIFLQLDGNNNERPIALIRRSLTNVEKNTEPRKLKASLSFGVSKNYTGTFTNLNSNFALITHHYCTYLDRDRNSMLE